MKCPKCDEGILCRIVFKKAKRKATLCDSCGSFWLDNEHVGISSEHMLHDKSKELSNSEDFYYEDEQDEENQESVDAHERKIFESS